MKTNFIAVFLTFCQLSHPGQTLAQKELITSASELPADYSFAIVVGLKFVNTEDDWKQGDRLRAYASSHGTSSCRTRHSVATNRCVAVHRL